MGRDFTPYEHYNADKRMGGTLRTVTFTDENGKEVQWFKPKEQRILSKYKELGFLFSESLIDLWDKMSGHPRYRKKILDKVEQDLELIINNISDQMVFDSFDKTLYDWYIGRLDPHFYYNNENNRLLEVYIYRKFVRMVGGDTDVV